METFVYLGKAFYKFTFAVFRRALSAFERATGALIATEAFVTVQVSETAHNAVWNPTFREALRGDGTDPRHECPPYGLLFPS